MPFASAFVAMPFAAALILVITNAAATLAVRVPTRTCSPPHRTAALSEAQSSEAPCQISPISFVFFLDESPTCGHSNYFPVTFSIFIRFFTLVTP
jgi:hypothetical protein